MHWDFIRSLEEKKAKHEYIYACVDDRRRMLSKYSDIEEKLNNLSKFLDVLLKKIARVLSVVEYFRKYVLFIWNLFHYQWYSIWSNMWSVEITFYIHQYYFWVIFPFHSLFATAFHILRAIHYNDDVFFLSKESWKREDFDEAVHTISRISLTI